MGAGSNLCLLLQVLIVVQLSPRISGIRKDVGFVGKQFCRSTVQGRYLVSDDNGHVCDALSINPQSRCCLETGHKFSCHGCNLVSECCDSYEYCVSCCLHPSRIIKEQALEVKIAKPASAGKYSSVFDFCAGRCRHNSDSVLLREKDQQGAFLCQGQYLGCVVLAMFWTSGWKDGGIL